MPPADPAPAADRYELCSRLLFGPGTWFELCRDAAGSPSAIAGLRARLAPGADAAEAFATRSSWPGESRLPQTPPAPDPGSASGDSLLLPASFLLPGPSPLPESSLLPESPAPGAGSAWSAAKAASDVLAAMDGGPGANDLLRSAAAHWRRANVLPTLPLTGAGIGSPTAPIARRLAVLTDDAAAADRAGLGFLAICVRAFARDLPRKRREAELPVLFDRRSTGGHGVLRLTLLDDGPPGLYPDPRSMLFLVADRRFAEALDTAWRTAGPRLHDRCVIWRLTTDGLPCDEIAGGSLGAAFGVGLADLAPRLLRARRLDRRCAVTAELQPDTRLAEAGGVPNKLEEAVRKRWRVVLAPARDPDTLPEALLRAARVRFAVDLAAAVRSCRTKMNPAFVALAAAVLLAASGIAGGAVAATRESRAAHQREIAVGLIPAAASVRRTDPATALLLEALAVRLGAPGARPVLVQSVVDNRFAGAFDGFAGIEDPCGGRQTWSPDGRLIASIRPATDEVRIWDTASRSLVRTVAMHDDVTGCAFSPDGLTLAIAVGGRLAQLPVLDPTSQPVLTTVEAVQVQFAPNGLLAAIGDHQPLRLWSVTGTPRLVGSIGADVSEGQRQPPVAFHAGMMAFIDRPNVVIADLARLRVRARLPVSAESLAFSPRGVLAIGRTDSLTELWDTGRPPRRTDVLRYQAPTGYVASSLGFGANGTLVVASHASSHVWQIGSEDPRRLRALAPVDSQVGSADLAPDGRTALVTFGSRPPSLWRVDSHGWPRAVVTLPGGTVSGVRFLPGTTQMLVTAAGGAAALWDVADPARPVHLRAVGPREGRGTRGGSSAASVFSGDSRFFAAADDDGGAGVWAVEGLRRVMTVPRSGDDEVVPLALSADGGLLVTRNHESNGLQQGELRDERIHLWAVREGTQPTATPPAESQPPGTTPAETRPPGTPPAETRPPGTPPAESQPPGTPPAETRPPGTTPAESQPPGTTPAESRPVATLPAVSDPEVAFAPDGRLVTVVRAGTSGDAVATWWNVADPRRPVTLASRRFAIEAPGVIAFSSDGRRMFVTSETGPGVSWDISDMSDPRLVHSQVSLHDGQALATATSGNTLVLSATGAIDVWDMTDPTLPAEVAVFATDDKSIFHEHLAISPTGLLATAQWAEGVVGQYTNESIIQLRNVSPILTAVTDPVAAACHIAGHDLPTTLWQRHAPGITPHPICP
ncbi:hypothetical protein AB0M02_27760 [Actinoplanes sp. NPDC051861]|uniref:WD40 repeat domain-containing protein n=1 Tax=Actinoplanes sp. NPDC051861 TaxID=3155170 RepID=UPI0034181F09